MIGQVYSASFNGVSVAAIQDLFELEMALTSGATLLSVHLSQETLVTDSNEEMWTIEIQGHTGTITNGSGGSAAAEVPTSIGFAAATGAVLVNNTTEISPAGATVVHHIANWNIRVPLDLIWMPETRIHVSPTDALTVTLTGTLTTATVGGTMYWSEGGGA